MDSEAINWSNLIFRWLHLVAGIMWIGHLWFFNFVNAQLAKTYTPESKKAVLPELMPRALYFFRWGALYTWVTGFLLMGLVYYMGGGLGTEPDKNGMGIGVSVGLIVVSFFIYDALWKSPLGKNEVAAATVSFVLLAGLTFGLSQLYGGRAVYIHLGAVMGTLMAMNVWMRIWPAQRKIIAGVKGTGPAPDAAVPALAGLRSKHNTYMSVPLMFFMISNHFPTVYGNDFGWVVALVMVLVGWGLTKFFYTKSASPAPASF